LNNWSSRTAPRVEVALARGSAPLTGDELDRLMRGLAALDSPAASSIADEIGALRLAGVRIQLLPTDDELAALHTALVEVDHHPRPNSGLTRLRALCDGGVRVRR
jgi:hypothetical protein